LLIDKAREYGYEGFWAVALTPSPSPHGRGGPELAFFKVPLPVGEGFRVREGHGCKGEAILNQRRRGALRSRWNWLGLRLPFRLAHLL
jgi:hypothetical protein